MDPWKVRTTRIYQHQPAEVSVFGNDRDDVEETEGQTELHGEKVYPLRK